MITAIFKEAVFSFDPKNYWKVVKDGYQIYVLKEPEEFHRAVPVVVTFDHLSGMMQRIYFNGHVEHDEVLTATEDT